MTKQLILSFVADDRPGLVDLLSGAIAESGGNWLESRMAHMAEKFAGIVRVELADANAAASLETRLASLEKQGIRVSVSQAHSAAKPGAAALIELVGLDHPGIVREITHCLASRSVSIETMDTYTEAAPMGGGILFHARMEVSFPPGLDQAGLRGELEQVAAELMVDLAMQEKPAERAAS
jgi:glycine cleavage system regulatory protein